VVAFTDWLCLYKKSPSCAARQNVRQSWGDDNCKPYTTEISGFQVSGVSKNNQKLKPETFFFTTQEVLDKIIEL
jgi:hypothetical protein